MTKHPIEVITSVERRRRWSREDKERLRGRGGSGKRSVGFPLSYFLSYFSLNYLLKFFDYVWFHFFS